MHSIPGRKVKGGGCVSKFGVQLGLVLNLVGCVLPSPDGYNRLVMFSQDVVFVFLMRLMEFYGLGCAG